MVLAASDRIGQALDLVGSDEAAIVRDLGRLLAVDTSFPPGDGYGALADLAEDLVAPLGFSCSRVSVPDALWSTPAGGAHGERVNLIASRPSGLPICSLYFHVDTVPPGEGWTRPPLALAQVDGRLYGRGAADMKGTIAATLAALRALERTGSPLRFEPRLLFCTDEEGGLYPGIRYLAEQGLVEGHLLSFNGGAAPRIWAGCFGSIDLLVRIRGRGAHSGEPVGGINAVEEAIPLLNALMALKGRVERRVSAMPSPPHYDGSPLHGRLTIAALHGGQKGSSLPAAFEILVNRRYAPEEDFPEVLAELEATVRDVMAPTQVLDVETHVIGHLAPVSDPTGPHWPRWQAALGRGFGFAPEEFRAWGSSSSSDMGFVQQAGIREILLGGLGRPDNNIHAPDEFTTMADVVALARSILAYLSGDFEAQV
ncbi:MAG TPA: M20/M25/M40 family metallo-hydrolase [Aliidongia sp.]|uniref:M20 family metallopeptidase n=1 Tax=Aliidongia sp. TaxID=1914230 RepID=UPI002DDD84B7|nr:M20/M25/M40 family metallo-hydrolase [Aliidongia sp.]HEV2677495.1 M20/M25/M40 family metallo-hydrolase [Aliidongia sp.]